MTDRQAPEARSSLAGVIAACCVVGIVVVGAALRYGAERPPALPDGASVPAAATEDYGRRLIAQTAELLGPDQPDADRRLIKSRLNCGSCHLATSRREQRRERVDEFRQVFDAATVGRKPRVLTELRRANCPDEAHPCRLVRGSDIDPAVGRRQRLVRCSEWMRRAHRPGRPSRRQRDRALPKRVCDAGLQ